jgi:hypothetical protein
MVFLQKMIVFQSGADCPNSKGNLIMPNLANITVKKFDGTTDVIYTGVSPASGDGSPAVWRNEAIGVAANHRPELRLTSKDVKSGKARGLRATYAYPQIATNTTTSLTSVVDTMRVSADWDIPKGMSQTDINEAAYQFGNLMAAALIKSCTASGYSAT